MDFDKPHQFPAELAEDNAQSKARESTLPRTFCVVGLVGVVISALWLTVSGALVGGDVCGVALLHIFLATLFANIVLLGGSGPNVLANHGGIGVLVGLFISSVITLNEKGSIILGLLGSFPGAVFGLVIGTIRASNAEAHAAAANASAAERAEHQEEENGPQ